MDEKGLLAGLIFECPLKDECCGLMKDIREKPVLERLKWLESLSDTEAYYIVMKHKECLREKERNLRPNY